MSDDGPRGAPSRGVRARRVILLQQRCGSLRWDLDYASVLPDRERYAQPEVLADDAPSRGLDRPVNGRTIAHDRADILT